MVIWLSTRCAAFSTDGRVLERCATDAVCRIDGAPFCAYHKTLIAARRSEGEQWGAEQPLDVEEKQ